MQPVLPAALLTAAGLFALAWLEARSIAAGGRLASQMAGRSVGPWQLIGVRRGLRRLAAATPRELAARDGRRLRRAGLDMSPEVLLGLRIAAGAGGAVLLVGLGAARGAALAGSGLPVLLGWVLGVAAVEFWLNAAGGRRRREVRAVWPLLLYRLGLCVRAGMSVERALLALAAQWAGPAGGPGPELRALVRLVGSGLSGDEAFARWGADLDSPEITALGSALNRARTMGQPLGPIIERHHGQARTKARQRCLAWLTGLPARLSVVAMLFFLPAILIVVLVPNILAFLRSGW